MNVIMHNETYDWSGAIGYSDQFNKWQAQSRDLYINSNGYDVVVRPWAESVKGNKYAAIFVTDNGFGLSTNGVKNAQVKVSYKNNYTDEDFVTGPSTYTVDKWWGGTEEKTEDKRMSANVVIIDLKAPQGLISYKNSKIEVVLPWDSGFAYNLHINSGNGDINVIPATDADSHKDEIGNLPLKSLYLTTNKGDAVVRGLVESGTYELENLVLKTNTGKFNLASQNLSIKNTGKVKIDSTRGDFEFKDITGSFVIRGENLVLKANGIYTNGQIFSYNCPNGTIDITNLNVANGVALIATEYAKVNISSLKGDTSIQATYGDTHIKNVSANVLDVTTTNGNITVEKAWVTGHKWDGDAQKYVADSGAYTGTIALRSTYGDIKVNDYEGNAWVTNNRGKIEINQSQKSYSNGKVEETKIETERGEVIASNLSDKVVATATGSANMTLSYYRLDAAVTCESKITIGSGQLNLNVPTHTAQTAEFAVKIEAIKDGGKVIMKSAGSVNNEYSNLDNLTNGYAKGDSSKKIEFHITVNGGKAVFDEFAQQY